MTAPTFAFPAGKRARFVARYVTGKTVGLMLDLRSGRLRMLVYEIVYSLCRALGRSPLPLRGLGITEVHSRFGRFEVRPGTIDVACASPAFERPDVDRLLAELRARTDGGRDVLFVDVGADLGTYTVTVGRALPRARLVAVEPSTVSAELLARNVDRNDLTDRVTVHRTACGDGTVDTAVLTYDADEPGSSGIRADVVHGEDHETVPVTTLDHLLRDVTPGVLALKLDVEGAEIGVLDGAREVVARSGEAVLLIEDFVDDAVVRYLEGTGWRFLDKLTPYNSFWLAPR